MFENINKYYTYENLIICSIVIIIFLSFFRIGKKGSWSTSYYLPTKHLKEKRKVVRESKGEIECKRVLEKIFRKKFVKERPDFLRNPVTGGTNNLELDCYNAELRLAVEYSGVQHYKYVPYFHKNKESFLNQKYRDDMKRRLCKENSVNLIEVPYTVKIEDIEDYIKKGVAFMKYKIN